MVANEDEPPRLHSFECEEKSVSNDDDLQKLIGDIGYYQILLMVLLLPCTAPTAFHTMNIVFLAPSVDYVCNDNVFHGNNVLLNVCPCKNPVFNETIFDSTMITKWSLICDRSWIVSFSQTILMFGILVGSVTFGSLSDKYGRRKSIAAAVALETIAGIGESLTPEIYSFFVFRFFLGASVGGVMVVVYVLVMEFTGQRYRELVSFLNEIPFNIGYLLLPLLGYVIKSWTAFNLVISLPPILMVLLYVWIPESPRWLLISGQTERAISVYKTAAKINKKPIEEIESTVVRYQQCLPQKSDSNGGFLNIFKSKKVLMNLLCTMIMWIVCSLSYFGINIYIGRLNGNLFANVAFTAFISSVGLTLTFFLVRIAPRKTSIILLNICVSICLILNAVIPENLQVAKVVFASVGSAAAYGTFVMAYLYTAEIFPTVIRNSCIGVNSMVSRFGSMVAPFIVTLGVKAQWLPPVVFGIAPILSIIACLFLPETKNKKLQDTFND